MIRTKTKAVVSISYYDFDFGDDLIAADAFANVARATLTDVNRCVELNVTYSPIEGDIEEDKEEEQDDQTTD